MPYSKLYILTELSANDVKFISVDRQKLDVSIHIYIYTYGTVNSIFVEIQPNSTNIKNDPHIKAIQLYEMFIFCTYSLVLNMIFGVKSMIVRTREMSINICK